MHHGQGLIEGDSAYFHSVAVDLAGRIQMHGWSEWSLYPATGATGNVALLAILYVLFGVDPSLMVPINAALHALTGTLFYLLGRMIWPGRVGTLAGVLAGTLFVVFPSALNWYGQIHKDGFAIAGIALILTGWVAAETGQPRNWRMPVVLGLTLSGIALIVFVRPYNLSLVLAGVTLMLATKLALLWQNRKSVEYRYGLFLQLALVAAVGLALYLAPRAAADEQNYAEWNQKSGEAHWQWQASSWFPEKLDRYVEVLARTRAGLVENNLRIQAGSLYDAAVLPASTLQVMAYVPRALQISLFAPFPSLWLEKLSATRLLSVAETVVWYLIAPGVLLALWLGRSRAMFALLAFSLALMTVYGITLANIGTLYRIRYLYLLLLMLVGLAGWLLYFERRGWLSRWLGQPRAKNPAPKASEDLRETRSGLAGSGMMVAAVTAVTFVGLFIRDVVMARLFGLGGELDAFVIATVVPMFLVAVLSVPIGTAIVPVFLTARARGAMHDALTLARQIALRFLIAALAIAAVLVFASRWLFESTGWLALPEPVAQAQVVTVWMLAIFVVSGLVTLANGLLNALGHYVVPAAAQAVVPVVAVVALLAFGSSHGVVVAAVAMFLGQLINLALVYRALAARGISIYPALRLETQATGQFMSYYLPLVAAAIFMQLAVPVNTAIAAMLPEGSVAAIGMGNKAVLFATGLIGTAMVSVVLPYFSRYMAQNKLLDARRELSFLLLVGTVISIPVTVMLHLLSEPFVRLAFGGGAFGAGDVSLVSRVMAYGILQLPFFVINMLLLKFAIATHRSGSVMLAAGIGLGANVLLSLWLMNRFGVPGIALAMTFSIAITAGLMLFLFWRRGDVEWVDMIFILTNWVLYLALAVCLHFGSYPGAVAAILAFCLLAMGEWMFTLRRRSAHAHAL